MNINLDLSTVFTGLTTAIVSIAAFMLKGVYKDFKEAITKISNHEVRLAVLEEKVKHFD